MGNPLGNVEFIIRVIFGCKLHELVEKLADPNYWTFLVELIEIEWRSGTLEGVD